MTSLLIKMDVIRCSVKAGLNFRGTKLSRMAVEPRKPRKFSTAKIKVHTVYSFSLISKWPSSTKGFALNTLSENGPFWGKVEARRVKIIILTKPIIYLSKT